MSELITQKIETGIDVIDEQHDEIIAFILQFEEVAKYGDRDVISNLITKIMDSCQRHFEFEETLMEEASYQYIRAHKQIHDHFFHSAIKYIQRFDQGETDVAIKLAAFFRSWAISHFANEDKDYCQVVLEELEGGGGGKDKTKGWLKGLFM